MTRKSYPSFDAALRIGILTPELSHRQIVRRMRKCRAIAASAPFLRTLAEAVETGRLELPPVPAAVVALTGICHGELTVLERDLFWRVFQVPVFEQLVAPDGRVLAMECDAHDGLHLLQQDTSLPGFRAFLETSPCGCGNPHPRVARIERLDRPSQAAPAVRPSAEPAHVYDDRHDQEQQVHAAGRVA